MQGTRTESLCMEPPINGIRDFKSQIRIKMKLIIHIYNNIEKLHPVIQLIIYGGITIVGLAVMVYGKNNNYF